MRIFPLIFILLIMVFLRPVNAQTDFTETDVTYTLERYSNVDFPVGMVFAPDGRLFYNEKIAGTVRVISAEGVRQREPVLSLPTDSLQERGMLGLALDPTYDETGFMWVVHTRAATARDWPANTLLRFREENGIGHEVQEFLSLPITTGDLRHNGGNVHFDADGYLYVSFGDFGEPSHGQNLDTPQSAIHRFDVRGDALVIPDDNPIPGNSIFAYGLRNPFDFTFDPLTGNLFAIDVGPSCDDEINLILPGFNYGWRENYTCVGTDFVPGLERYAAPLISLTPVEAPAGILIYDNPAVPEWHGDLFYCTWSFGEMWRVELNESRARVESRQRVDLGGVQCRLDIVQGPDDALYFGTVGGGEGAIYRLMPEAASSTAS